MAPLSYILPSAMLVAAAQAHFTMKYPESIGFDDGAQGSGPCGGVTPDFDTNTVTDFHVGGDAIGMQNGHSQVNWLFRATLDKTASGNWTQIFPIVQQVGLNLFCEPGVTIPEEFVGQQGIIGVVANAPDGLLYQCAAVKFVEGVGQSQDSCANSTDVQAAFVDDTSLTALVGDETAGSDDSSSSSAPTSTSTGSDSESTGTDNSSAMSLGPALGGVISALLMGAAFLA